MNIHYLTLFPEMYDGVLNSSILKRAKDKGIVDYNLIDFRDYTEDKHNKVDDYPYGGGAGMVFTSAPLFNAMDAMEVEKPRVILLCPQGEQFNQKMAEDLSTEENIVFICEHYEGYDERIRTLVTDEVSIG